MANEELIQCFWTSYPKVLNWIEKLSFFNKSEKSFLNACSRYRYHINSVAHWFRPFETWRFKEMKSSIGFVSIREYRVADFYHCNKSLSILLDSHWCTTIYMLPCNTYVMVSRHIANGVYQTFRSNSSSSSNRRTLHFHLQCWMHFEILLIFALQPNRIPKTIR